MVEPKEDDFLDDKEEAASEEAEVEMIDINEEADRLDELEAIKNERDEFRDRFVRALADAENARKRADKDRREAENYGGSKLARDLLPVYDNLKRAVDAVTELDFQRYRLGSNPSPSHGYVTGGTKITPPTVSYSNDMVKYSFTSTSTATDVGDLTSSGRIRIGSSSSTVSGYSHGGQAPSPVNIIEKFPFAADANATDVGDLTTNSGAHAGVHQ